MVLLNIYELMEVAEIIPPFPKLLHIILLDTLELLDDDKYIPRFVLLYAVLLTIAVLEEVSSVIPFLLLPEALLLKTPVLLE
jgi:hypothetical protein